MVPVLLSWNNLNFSRNRDMILYILEHEYFLFLHEIVRYKLEYSFSITVFDVLIVELILRLYIT